jgi:hypothetical protein
MRGSYFNSLLSRAFLGATSYYLKIDEKNKGKTTLGGVGVGAECNSKFK